jgi:hypothetical protein
MPVKFDENYVTEKQEKLAHKVIKEVPKYLGLKIVSYIILGLNPAMLIEELQQEALGKNQYEKNLIENQIKNVKVNVNDYVMVKFSFDNVLKKLTFLRTTDPQKKIPGFYFIWTGFLDFPIKTPLIFGRVSLEPKHGGGTYCFAQINHELEIEFEKQTDPPISTEQYLMKLSQEYNFIQYLQSLRNHPHSAEQMITVFNLLRSHQQTGNMVIDTLNLNRDLITVMKSIGHLGTYKFGQRRFATQFDISTICVLHKNITLLQLENFDSSHQHSLRSIRALTDALMKL